MQHLEITKSSQITFFSQASLNKGQIYDVDPGLQVSWTVQLASDVVERADGNLNVLLLGRTIKQPGCPFIIYSSITEPYDQQWSTPWATSTVKVKQSVILFDTFEQVKDYLTKTEAGCRILDRVAEYKEISRPGKYIWLKANLSEEEVRRCA